MKKSKKAILSCAVAAIMAASSLFTGCGLFGGGDDTSDAPVVYTIQYTDDAGTHTIEVEDGDPYAIESIPQREGYDFVGLFDAEVGGTQYVSANGSSLAPFNDGKNMVLFPQYKAKQYTVVLDYQGAAVTGDRQLTVNYGESLPELPKNLTLDHSTFSGWYTQPNRQGIQIADEYGLIPIVSVINSDNFDLSTQYINLYAGFAVQQFTVTFNFGNGIQSQEMQVDYNTPISQIVPDVRNSEGEAVLSWSTSQSGGNLFTGNITGDTVLYAVEWAPVIELDANGGDAVTPIVAREGASVTLPTPVRANYRFMGWQDENGDIAQIATMPAGGASLTASWQAMLVFDENGGAEVNDLSQPVGTAITLPAPEREGYIFAGWYIEDETKYEVTSMPSASVELRAGWYKSEEVQKVFINSTESLKLNIREMFAPRRESYEVNLNTILGTEDFKNITPMIHVDIRFSSKSDVDTYKSYPRVFLTRTTDINSTSIYTQKDFYSGGSTAWQKREMQANITLYNGVFFVIFQANEESGSTPNRDLYISDFYVTITYPDVTNLYL